MANKEPKFVFINENSIVVGLFPYAIQNNQNPRLIELVPGEQVQVGWKYTAGGTPRFAYVEPQVFFSWTAFQFLLRFTEAEREAFRTAALTDGKVADFIQLCGAASEVESNHPLTLAGIAYLVSQGLLTQDRANQVLGV